MLPEQDSGTNQTASTSISAHTAFDGFLSHETYTPIESPTHDQVKTEQDHNTNQGYQDMMQHARQETQQQQYNMARPGQYQAHEYNDDQENDFRALHAALAAGIAGNAGYHLQPKAGVERPCTPPPSFNVCQFPITPDTSPAPMPALSREMLRSKTADSSPSRGTRPFDQAVHHNAAVTMRRTSSYPNDKSSVEAELDRILNTGPSPAVSAGLIPPPNFLQFPDLTTLTMDFVAKGSECDSSHYSPMSSALTPLMSSFESSPEMANMSLFDNISGLPDLSLPSRASNLPSLQGTYDQEAYPSPPKERSHKRTQSAATVDVDGTNEETGVTEDEITMYIVGPNNDNKYMCTYDGCNKLFGRKENIRSHVQTHLGDRQWRCNHCNKRFVRQHDLKRHAKIHTGQKPHLCPCGNGFARHDALTRHRQRNTCIGGFGVVEGMPQSPSKRGRPKKRPDMESRRDKAARTRERALEKATASSMSGSSEFSAPSPEMFFEELIMGTAGPDNMVMIQSQETDEALEAMHAMSPEMVEECLREMSKSSSPFSDFQDDNLFGTETNAFDNTYDPTPAWLL
ncbi:MAG: hypothetical protein LQ350_004554 [Teloschistes chrysophthalmus]|nr:MAG: hypothetical protein LQ350_004554 [Niorma chrysophthalma]